MLKDRSFETLKRLQRTKKCHKNKRDVNVLEVEKKELSSKEQVGVENVFFSNQRHKTFLSVNY